MCDMVTASNALGQVLEPLTLLACWCDNSVLQVAEFHRNGLPVAIVRPTLVCGLAGDPYPGYCGNLAGPVSAAVLL